MCRATSKQVGTSSVAEGENAVNAKGSEHRSLSQVIVELEAIDAGLAALPTSAPIAEARAQLRTAITTLSAVQNPGDDTATGKRRVKIKAASDTPAAAPAGAAQTPARSAASSKGTAKSGAKRGERAQPSPEMASTLTAPASSLLARLGAVASPAAPQAPAPFAPTDQAPTSPSAPVPSASIEAKSISAEDAVSRLARLEAEIASLTEPSPGTLAKSPGKSRPAGAIKPPSPAPSAAPDGAARASVPRPSADSIADNESEAEVVIVGSDTPTGGRAAAADRQTPRVYRDAPPSADDEDAEVEIVQPGVETRVRGGDGQARSPAAGAKAAAPGRWRLFRGSR